MPKAKFEDVSMFLHFKKYQIKVWKHQSLAQTLKITIQTPQDFTSFKVTLIPTLALLKFVENATYGLLVL